MKNTNKFVWIIALAAVIGFSTVTCGGEDTSGVEGVAKAVYRGMDNAANIYELVVSKAAGRSAGKAGFAAQADDDYELTVTPPNGTSRTSEGLVDQSVDGGFSLKPKGATKVFNVAVNGGEIIAIAGEIKYTNGNIETKQVVMPPSTTGGSAISGNTIISGADVAYDPDLANLNAAKAVTEFPYALDMGGGGNGDGNGNGGGSGGPSVIDISDFLTGTTSITVTNGKVTITVGTPKELKPFPEGFTVTPSSAKYFGSEGGNPVVFANELNPESYDSLYGLICVLNNDSYAGLVYVDQDVTIKASEAHDGIIEVMDMNVKQGWNYLFTTKNANFVVYSATKAMPAGYKWTVIDQNTKIRLGYDGNNGNGGQGNGNGQGNNGGNPMLTGTWILDSDGGIKLDLQNDNGTFRMSEKASDGRYMEKETGTFFASGSNITVTTLEISTERIREKPEWATLTFTKEWYTQNDLWAFLTNEGLSTKDVPERFKTQNGTYSITTDPPRIFRLTIGGEEMAFSQQ